MTNNPVPEHMIPFSPEAEEAVLGALQINPGELVAVRRILNPPDFFLLRTRWVYEAVCQCDDAKEPWDYLVIAERLRANGHLDEIGGVPYLMRLVNNTPTSIHVEVYAQLVKRVAVRRGLLDVSDKIQRLAMDESRDTEIILAQAAEDVWPILLSPKKRERLTTFGNALSHLYDAISEDRQMGVLSGMEPLDELFYGWQRAKFYLVGARPGVGKTQFLLSAALGMALRGSRILFVTLEMDADELASRLAASMLEVPSDAIIRNTITDEQTGRLTTLLVNSQKLPFYIDDSPGQTIRSITLQARYLAATVGLDAVFIDYIQLVSGSDRRLSRLDEMSDVARGAKDMAKLLNLPVIAAAQIGRQVDERKQHEPMISDLKETGELEQAADVIIFPYREDYYKPVYVKVSGRSVLNWVSNAKIIVAKHRGGTLATFDALFNRASNNWAFV